MTQWIPTREALALVTVYERDQAQRRIFAELVAGGLSAIAEFFTFEGSEHRDEPMSREFWDVTWTRLDFATGSARRVITSIFAVPNPSGSGMIVPVLADDRATGIRIDRDELLTFWPDVFKPTEGQPK